MHRAGTGEGHPDAVQHVAVGKHPDVQVGLQNVVETANLLVAKKRVRHPDFVGICHCQVTNLT
jgi:hypothetical protein